MRDEFDLVSLHFIFVNNISVSHCEDMIYPFLYSNQCQILYLYTFCALLQAFKSNRNLNPRLCIRLKASVCWLDVAAHVTDVCLHLRF